MNDFLNEYNRLCADPSRVDNFRKTGEDGIRIFNVLNTNIKTLKTVGEYIDTLYPLTTYNADHKQKIRRLKEFNFRSLDNHSDPRAIIRSDIVICAGRKFSGYDSAFVTLILYLLLLDTGNGSSTTVVRTRDFINDIPTFLKRKLYGYAKQIAVSGPFLNDNIYQEIVVFYGDTRVYKEFIDFVRDYYPDEEAISNLFVSEAAKSNSPISKRLDNFQRSALKKDALYAIIFYSLDQFVRESKMKGLRTGKRIRNADEFLIEYLDYFNNIFDGQIAWLGRLDRGDTIESLKSFINVDLTPDQREEIHKCICNAFDLFVPEEIE